MVMMGFVTKSDTPQALKLSPAQVSISKSSLEIQSLAIPAGITGMSTWTVEHLSFRKAHITTWHSKDPQQGLLFAQTAETGAGESLGPPRPIFRRGLGKDMSSIRFGKPTKVVAGTTSHTCSKIPMVSSTSIRESRGRETFC